MLAQGSGVVGLDLFFSFIVYPAQLSDSHFRQESKKGEEEEEEGKEEKRLTAPQTVTPLFAFVEMAQTPDPCRSGRKL